MWCEALRPAVLTAFRILGVLLACYVVQALMSGSVYARSRWWGRTLERASNPFGYWMAIVCYALLALALVFLFGRPWRSR